MPALDLIRPSVTAMRVIASVNDGFARELKLPPHIRSLGLITADSDDVAYIAADEATKQAMVEVVYGRSLYAGAAHSPSPTSGEVLIMLGGPNPAEVRAGLDAMAYLVAPPLEATFGIDAALKSADVQLVTYVPPPSETNYSAAFMTGSQAACKAACNAFADAVLDIARNPIQRA